MNSRAYILYNKCTKIVMESINVVIDDVIPVKSADEDGEAPSFKKNDGDDNSSQSNDVGIQSLEKETTPTTSRRETRST